jgi:hypothetical protein
VLSRYRVSASINHVPSCQRRLSDDNTAEFAQLQRVGL